jgi:hypothetical protein
MEEDEKAKSTQEWVISEHWGEDKNQSGFPENFSINHYRSVISFLSFFLVYYHRV